MGQERHGPRKTWAEEDMGQGRHGPRKTWAEEDMGRGRHGPRKTRAKKDKGREDKGKERQGPRKTRGEEGRRQVKLCIPITLVILKCLQSVWSLGTSSQEVRLDIPALEGVVH